MYGNTWWSNAWIKILSNTDCDISILPMGRSYANTDKVNDIQINLGGTVSANVRGTRANFYQVTMKLKPYTKEQISTIQRLINKDPILRADFIIGRLPEVLLEILYEHNIDLLPSSWNGIDAWCSCTDGVNPCKHLAALHYALAKEINKNPFILLQFRGITDDDLPKVDNQYIDDFKKQLSSIVAPVIKIELPRRDSERFRMLIYVKSKTDPTAPIIPLRKIFSNKGEFFSYPASIIRSEISRQMIIASEFLPILKTLLQHQGRKNATIGLQTLPKLLEDTFQNLSFHGIEIMLPEQLKELQQPKIAIGGIPKEAANKDSSYLRLSEMFDFSWRVAIGDMLLTAEEFEELQKNAGKIIKDTGKIVKHQGVYFLLKPNDTKHILKRLKRPEPKLSSMEIVRGAMTGEILDVDFIPDQMLDEMIIHLTAKEEKELQISASLKANLRPYQYRGLNWLYANLKKGIGSCLADDMGLGKTLQIIAVMVQLKEEGWLKGPALVICPTSLIGNWVKEVANFAPSLKVGVYHGYNRQLDENADITITSYGILRRDKSIFKDKQWNLLVIDEAQNIKNPNAKQSKAVKEVKAKGYIAMTGTPVENELMELWSIFDFINKGLLGTRREFRKYFADPIEKYRDAEKIEKLRKVTAPFILRRVKNDQSVIKDLPKKIIKNEYVYLSSEQAALYQEVTDALLDEIEYKKGIERKGTIFKLITSLKQICNHPAQFTKNGKALKRDSGKAEKAIDLLQKFLSKKEKVLIFTQYKEMGNLLLELIARELKENVLFFHGGLSRGQRDNMVDEFQDPSSGKSIMIVSLRAGGTGLNLIAASNVIHYDLWWNPAVEDQATDRTYRIGQLNNVMVHRLISIGTFEEKINKMIQDKRELAQLTVAAGESRISEMSNNELRELFTLWH